MTFGQSIQTVFRRYAEFRGRASRPEFWWWILFLTLVGLALQTVPTVGFSFPTGVVTYGNSLSSLWNLAVLVPTLAVAVRRLRDAGYPWGHLFWLLLPVLGLLILVILLTQPGRPRADRF